MTTLYVFDIPNDDALLANWLQAQIAGPHLGELVAELDALQETDLLPGSRDRRNGSSPGEPTLDAVLGGRLSDVCERGLEDVPATLVRRLFRHPDLLIELQAHVLAQPTAFWDQKLTESLDLSETVDTGWLRLIKGLGITEAARGREQSVRDRPANRRTKPARWFVAGLATAAAVAAVAFVVQDRFVGSQVVARVGWGWNQRHPLPNNLPRSEYLGLLADLSEEWRRERPDQSAALAQRINEFRAGCSRLILSEHPSLPPADRKWLTDKCRAWAKTLDGHLAALEAGQDALVVRDQVDGTIQSLAKALRDRAAHPPET